MARIEHPSGISDTQARPINVSFSSNPGAQTDGASAEIEDDARAPGKSRLERRRSFIRDILKTKIEAKNNRLLEVEEKKPLPQLQVYKIGEKLSCRFRTAPNVTEAHQTLLTSNNDSVELMLSVSDQLGDNAPVFTVDIVPPTIDVDDDENFHTLLINLFSMFEGASAADILHQGAEENLDNEITTPNAKIGAIQSVLLANTSDSAAVPGEAVNRSAVAGISLDKEYRRMRRDFYADWTGDADNAGDPVVGVVGGEPASEVSEISQMLKSLFSR